MVDRNFMGHDEVGIWAISDIKERRNQLLRFRNPPSNPNDPLITLSTSTSINLWYWDIRRFGLSSFEQGWLSTADLHDSEMLFEKYKVYLAQNSPKKLKHLLEDMEEEEQIQTKRRLFT